MINLQQFRIEVVRPTLQHCRLWSPAAERLMLGTAAVESGLEYLRQIGGGPALGLYQVEPNTRHDIHANFLPYRAALREKVGELMFDGMDLNRQLVVNLAYSTAIARIVYFRKPQALPDEDDTAGLAAYWKKHFNTPLGKGDPAKFEKLMKSLEI